jgi:hypothetical protein
MILRHRVRSVLIVCPSSLQVQWKEEMRDKFGLEFRIVDSEAISLLRRKRGIHVNPWSHFPRLITSIDFLKRERPLRTFRETLQTSWVRRSQVLPPVPQAGEAQHAAVRGADEIGLLAVRPHNPFVIAGCRDDAPMAV